MGACATAFAQESAGGGAVPAAGAADAGSPGAWAVVGWMAAAAVALVVLRRARWFALLPRVGPAWPLRAEPSMFAFAGAFFASAAGAWLAWRAFGLAGAADGAASLPRQAAGALGSQAAQAAVVATVWFLPGVRARGASTVVARGGVHRHPCGVGEALLMAAAVALLAWPLTQAVGGGITLVQRWMGAPPPQLGHETLLALQASGPRDPWWWAAVAGAAIGAPVVEEFLWRGFLQQGLKATGMGVRAAVTVTACLFALIHLPALPEGARLVGVCTLVVLGAAWGLLFERTGRIAAPIAAHAAFNAANLLLA